MGGLPDEDMPEELHDRAADNWRPLFAIAVSLGGSCRQQARVASIAITVRDDLGSVGVMLLQDIRLIFSKCGKDRMSTKEILDQLNDMESRPWPEYRNCKGLTDRQMAQVLSNFSITPTTMRFAAGTVAKGYALVSFEDAFSRYLPATAVTLLQAPETKDLATAPAVTEELTVTEVDPKKANEIPASYAVTDATPVAAMREEMPELPEFLRRAKPAPTLQ